MKIIVLLSLLLYFGVANGQNNPDVLKGKEVIVDNDKMKVVKFTGMPQEDVCGKDMHHHEAHLTVALTDAELLITSDNGETQKAEIPSDAAIWFEAGRHAVINTGLTPTKFLLVYLKE